MLLNLRHDAVDSTHRVTANWASKNSNKVPDLAKISTQVNVEIAGCARCSRRLALLCVVGNILNNDVHLHYV